MSAERAPPRRTGASTECVLVPVRDVRELLEKLIELENAIESMGAARFELRMARMRIESLLTTETVTK